MKTYQLNTKQNVSAPAFFYGTAWKEEKTADLTYNALQSGFRAIDTANQRKHYFEKGAGDGIAAFLKESDLDRKDLFIQTKFTYLRGQDERLPYDPESSYTEQVNSSFLSSLEHLQTDYLDSLVLHGPFLNEGITDEDIETWQAMEQLYHDGKVRCLGVSNFQAAQLSELLDRCDIKPAFVQNRCYARMNWDQSMREVCQNNDVIYQGFSLLTANRAELSLPLVSELAAKHACTIPQLVFRFSQDLGMITLTGTSNSENMVNNLKLESIELNDSERQTLLHISQKM